MDYDQAATVFQKIWKGRKTREQLSVACDWYRNVINEIDNKAYKKEEIFPTVSKYSILRSPMVLNTKNIFHAPMKEISVLEVTYSDDFENDTSVNSENTELLHSTAKLEKNVENDDETNSDKSIKSDEHVETNSSQQQEVSSFVLSDNIEDTKQLMLNQKKDITMELLWVQQAIDSRRNYLHVKQQIVAN